MFKDILKQVKVTGREDSREDYLIFKKGMFNTFTGKREEMKFEMPASSTWLQINKRLYAGGGTSETLYGEYESTFFSVDNQGRRVELQPL